MDVALDRLESEQAIRRLQYEYGYRCAAGDWSGAAALFTTDGELEVGADGRHLGPDAIEAYLASTFGSAAADAVHAHLQIMPVVTLSPDGGAARATWRELGFGGGEGVDAYWAEGPIEVAYVRRAGRWQIARLHWRRTLHVPFDGGWSAHPSTPPAPGRAPSAPPSATPREWPDVAEPVRFHFEEAVDWSALAGEPPAETDARRPMRERLERLDAERELERLQSRFGYYVDKGLWRHATALLTDQATLVLPGGARVEGRDAVLDWLHGFGPEGPEHGRLLDSILVQPIIDVELEAGRARGRVRAFLQWARWGASHELGLLDLATEFVRVGDDWRIASITVTDATFTSYDAGWARDRRERSRMCPAGTALGAAPSPGDAPASGGPQTIAPSRARTPAELLAQLEAISAIERVQVIYGYCLSVFAWDLLASLFTEDGSIEVALRGVYRGRAAVRRHLELYGSGPEYGVLHNHMQFQPVVHLSADGASATIRARAFSMMGELGGLTRWMGGLYENEFVLDDGQWRIRSVRLINTYFAPTDVGWKDLPQGRAPGITESNPPDAPPSEHFDLYPAPYLLPFSYPPPETLGDAHADVRAHLRR